MKNALLYVLFAVTATIIIVNRFTDFYLSDYRLHFIMLFIAASTFVIIVGRLFKKLQSTRSIVLIVLLVGLLCFLKAYFTWGGDWKTETVLYRNVDSDQETIDLQLRGDRFAFGYKKRHVKVFRIMPGMMWTSDVDTTKLDRKKWFRVDEHVNSRQKL